MAQFDDISAAFLAVMQQIAEVRGEAAAGRLLAVHALDLLMGMAPDPETVLEALDRKVDATLNGLFSEAPEPAAQALNDISRETARLRCYELLDSLRSYHRGRE